MDQFEVIEINWGFYDVGIFCRLVISADEALNAKIMVEVDKNSGAMLTEFKQPNLLPEDHVPRGYEENGHVEIGMSAGSSEGLQWDYEQIPSDWTYYILYSYNMMEHNPAN